MHSDVTIVKALINKKIVQIDLASANRSSYSDIDHRIEYLGCGIYYSYGKQKARDTTPVHFWKHKEDPKQLNKIKMRTAKVKAIFKGLDGSCGYKTNSEYTLIIRHKTDAYIQVEDINGGGWCEYGSMVSFLENWDNVRRS